MANLFEKLGLIEKTEKHPDINDFLEKNPEYFPSSEQVEDTREVDISGAAATNEDLDGALGQVNRVLSDVNKDLTTTIDKVDELRSNLPDTMPLETARATVKAMLTSFQIDIATLVNDGYDRLEAVNNMMLSETQTYSEIIAERENEIEEYKEKIQECERKIQQAKSYIAAVKSVCAEKVEYYCGLGEFLNPGFCDGNNELKEQ